MKDKLNKNQSQRDNHDQAHEPQVNPSETSQTPSSKKNDKRGSMGSQVSEELETLRMQLESMTEALQRERADAMNVRRRAQEEKARMGNFYKALMVKSLLPAIDNLERALKHVPGDLDGHEYVKGVQGIAKQFENAFGELGVERIATIGEIFDPGLHEAVCMDDGEGDVERVYEELQPGYRIGDEIIRHAIVRVRTDHGKQS